MRAPLPIDDVLPEVVARLREAGNLVLRAPTGAGKTTRVPGALLDAGLAGEKLVVVLEPRRMAARAAARRVAFERGGEVGGEVGWRVRFEERAGPGTRILFATEGVLLRMLQADPFLGAVGAVVFDEFHERSLDADLALAMCRRVQLDARGPEEPLRLVVMSATLAAEPIARFLGDAPIVVSEGRLFPVTVCHLTSAERAATRDEDAAGAAARASERLARETTGHVLVFLPGVGEIRRAHERLAEFAARSGRELHELYGDLAPEEQDRVLAPGARAKIVLATNVAEASLTIEGVTAVVDSGLARKLVYDPALGLDRLRLGPISRASAEQRTGRAGRTGPGTCLRLWTEQEERSLAAEDEPEVRRVDVARAYLELAAFGEPELRAFPWLDAPPEPALERALELLRLLGALDGRLVITALGKRLARLPLAPRLARMLDEAARLGAARSAALAAALLAERDPFVRTRRAASGRDSESDLLDAVRALESFAATRETHSAAGELRREGAFAVLRARDQLARLVRAPRADEAADLAAALGRAVFAAYPDRLCRRRADDPRRGVGILGRGVRLADESAVRSAELFCALELDGGGEEALVRRASAVERDWLDEALLTRAVEHEWDGDRERVVAFARTRYGTLVLEEAPAPVGPEAGTVLAAAAARDVRRALDLEREEIAVLLARIEFLRTALAESEWPSLDDEFWRGLLPELCAGARSFAELRAVPLADFVHARLGAERTATLDREAPATLPVPSGSRLRVRYERGRTPVLAARIQELFGLAQTPRLARGRVPVLLHLLAPNHRPQQVTDDLASFWNGAYHEVRKELRRRYPRHSWPEDPWNAPAERRPAKRPPR